MFVVTHTLPHAWSPSGERYNAKYACFSNTHATCEHLRPMGTLKGQKAILVASVPVR